jgi:phospholipid/cholesterol/gamma-HCH transport system permease protein
MMPQPARLLAGVGHATRQQSRRAGMHAAFAGRIARSAVEVGPGSLRHGGLILLRQLRFTAVHALPLVGALALMVGVTVILQAYAQAVRLGVPNVPARLLATAVFREAGPLITAMVVLGRSGTAISAELASGVVRGETEALEAFGVDPVQLLVLPRIIACAIGTLFLTICFDAVAFGSGILAARALAGVTVEHSIESLRLVLSARDVILTAVKAMVFGMGIAFICSFSGLSVRPGQPTEVPQAVTAGVVRSLLFIFLVSASATLMVYR